MSYISVWREGIGLLYKKNAQTCTWSNLIFVSKKKIAEWDTVHWFADEWLYTTRGDSPTPSHHHFSSQRKKSFKPHRRRDLTHRRRRDLQDGLSRAAGWPPHATGRRRWETPVARVSDRGGCRYRHHARLRLRLPLPRRPLPPVCICPPMVAPRTALSLSLSCFLLSALHLVRNGDLGGYCARLLISDWDEFIGLPLTNHEWFKEPEGSISSSAQWIDPMKCSR